MKPTLLNCGGKLLNVAEPVVMGILNTTPDSFFDGGRYVVLEQALVRAEQMLLEGAKIIDIGGASSRPGSDIVPVEEELRRTIPLIKSIKRQFPEAIISIDTWRAAVAGEAVAAGAHLVNDISAGKLDSEMYRTVGLLGVPYVLMHMKGTPQTMQQLADYEHITLEIVDFLNREIALLRSFGVKDIVVDPGFGFGKTADHNFQLLNNLSDLSVLNLPILVGLSRKSFLYKTLGKAPSEVLPGTSALQWAALERGARVLRVHDVAAAVQTVELFKLCFATPRSGSTV